MDNTLPITNPNDQKFQQTATADGNSIQQPTKRSIKKLVAIVVAALLFVGASITIFPGQFFQVTGDSVGYDNKTTVWSESLTLLWSAPKVDDFVIFDYCANPYDCSNTTNAFIGQIKYIEAANTQTTYHIQSKKAGKPWQVSREKIHHRVVFPKPNSQLVSMEPEAIALTSNPTPEPTIKPSPSITPTVKPTTKPTLKPTPKPTTTPTSTPAPTATPTPVPTPSPTPTVTPTPNLCHINTDPKSGTKPFSVELGYGLTNVANNAYVTGAQWDFEADGTWDTDMAIANSRVTHVYETVGVHTIKLRLQLSDGSTTQTCQETIVVQPN